MSQQIARARPACALFFSIAAIAIPVLFASSAAYGLSVGYAAIDLIDETVGEDLWEYRYSLDEFPYGTDHSLTITFELGLYEALDANAASPGSDWDVLVFQPDPFLPADGLFDALSLATEPSLAEDFVVRFIWLGTAGSRPEAQAFRIDAFTPTGLFQSTVEVGTTVPVPEPTSAFLIAMGLLLLSRQPPYTGAATQRSRRA